MSVKCTARARIGGVTEQALARARAGDEQAFRELTDPYRRELQLHVYRIVGSTQDAEDLLQETLLAASARPSRTPSSSGTSSAASPTRSRRATSMEWSRCLPTTLG
jgi:DNA-directed RNA polymerase specialized sigma24 family protein